MGMQFSTRPPANVLHSLLLRKQGVRLEQRARRCCGTALYLPAAAPAPTHCSPTRCASPRTRGRGCHQIGKAAEYTAVSRSRPAWGRNQWCRRCWCAASSGAWPASCGRCDPWCWLVLLLTSKFDLSPLDDKALGGARRLTVLSGVGDELAASSEETRTGSSNRKGRSIALCLRRNMHRYQQLARVLKFDLQPDQQHGANSAAVMRQQCFRPSQHPQRLPALDNNGKTKSFLQKYLSHQPA